MDVGWLSRNRSWIRHEGWLSRGCVAVDSVHIGVGKWLKRQLEFRDEQRMIGSIRDVAPPLGRPSGSASLRGI